jgi:hypothetical protein
MIQISGFGDFQIDPSGTMTYCANNPTDPLCHQGTTGGSTYIQSQSTWIPSSVPSVKVTPGAAAPTAGTQISTPAGGSVPSPFRAQAGGFLNFSPGWYFSWWGLLLLAGVGYGVYRYSQRGKAAPKAA